MEIGKRKDARGLLAVEKDDPPPQSRNRMHSVCIRGDPHLSDCLDEEGLVTVQQMRTMAIEQLESLRHMV